MAPLHSLILTLFLLFSSLSYTQSKLQIRGEKFLKKEQFEEAKNYFLNLDSTKAKSDPLYNYYMGVVYYSSSNEQELGIPYMLDYIEEVDSARIEYYGHHHIYYMLAKLYHLSYEFDAAEKYYNEFIVKIEGTPSLSKKNKELLIENAKRQIENCSFGRIAIRNPRHVIIESLGDSINTIYPEYAAVVSQDEKTLFFTSRRPSTTGGKKDKSGNYFEDIYTATLEKGSLFDVDKRDTITTQGYYFNLVTEFQYSKFGSAGRIINSKKHDGSIQLDQKDSLIYFYKDFDIWYAEVDSNSLTEAKKMGTHVNSDNFEPSIFFSYNGEKLFIVSDRPGGYGGLDIYISEKDENGEWGPARNLGPNINTPFNEDAPYLDPNERTFYFSSEGHSSMGGYDVFRSTMKDTTYSSPVNLGFPINTPGEDIYFTMTKRYNRGYYSSNNLKGEGDMDIYRITFADERDPIAELKGYVKEGDRLIPANSKITLTARDIDETISTQSDTITGDYFLLLGHGKTYDMHVETEGFAPYTHTFDIPDQENYFQLYQEIHHVHLYNSDGEIIGQKITLFNALGEPDTTIKWFAYDEETKLRLKQIGYELDYNGLITVNSDVKFYMTFDSLVAAMQRDTNLVFKFNPDTKISYLKYETSPNLEQDSYSSAGLPVISKENDTTYIADGTEPPPNDTTSALKNEENISISEDVKYLEGLFFTVQIGVYSQPVSAAKLHNISPLNSQVSPEGKIRYSTGQFTTVEEAIKRKNEVIKLGITDAFVTSYYDGLRYTVNEAKTMIEQKGETILNKE